MNDTSYFRGRPVRPVLTPSEEFELYLKIQMGDEKAFDLLVVNNLPLVIRITNDFRVKDQYKSVGLKEMMISEGTIGLMKAARKFDATKGKFGTYAAWWIRQAIYKGLAEKTTRFPFKMHYAMFLKYNKIKKTEEDMVRNLHRYPSDEELAQEVEFPLMVIRRLRHLKLKPLSMEEHLIEGEKSVVSDFVQTKDKDSIPGFTLQTEDDKKRLRQLMSEGLLTDREKKVLILRYGLDGKRPKSLEFIRLKIGKTRERVRQIQIDAVKKLKKVFFKNNVKQGELCESSCTDD